MNPGVAVMARGVCKAYAEGGVHMPVLNDLSLTLRYGESVAVLGVSGTGKSTLLNLLSGIDRVDAGEIVVEGQALHQLDAAALARYRREKVGFVFQFYNLLPTLTALENVLTGWEAAGLPPAQGEAAAHEALATLGLADRADRFPEQLSGGEQQRVAIARALVKRPVLVLADEPTGNLDPRTADTTTQLLLDQARTYGSALVIVTHNPAIGSHTDRTLQLCDGRLEQHHPVTLAALHGMAA